MRVCIVISVSSIIAAFGKAIQCLAKIGNELYIEALRKGVSFSYLIGYMHYMQLNTTVIRIGIYFNLSVT